MKPPEERARELVREPEFLLEPVALIAALIRDERKAGNREVLDMVPKDRRDVIRAWMDVTHRLLHAEERVAELEKLTGRCEEALLVPDPRKERQLLTDLKADRNGPKLAARAAPQTGEANQVPKKEV